MEDIPEDFIELEDFADDLMGPPDLINEDSDVSSDLGAVDDGPHIDLDDPHRQHDEDLEEEGLDDGLGRITDASSQGDDDSDSDPPTPEGYYDRLGKELEAEELAAASDSD